MDLILDDEDFQLKIEDRSNGLFEPKAGKPELEVHRIISRRNGVDVVKDQDVRSVLDLTRLKQVKTKPTPIQSPDHMKNTSSPKASTRRAVLLNYF